MAPSRKYSGATTAQRCKILWGGKAPAKNPDGSTSGVKVITDTTWALQVVHETIGLVKISVKAGNRDMALTGYVDTSKTKISEALLRRRYR